MTLGAAIGIIIIVLIVCFIFFGRQQTFTTPKAGFISTKNRQNLSEGGAGHMASQLSKGVNRVVRGPGSGAPPAAGPPPSDDSGENGFM